MTHKVLITGGKGFIGSHLCKRLEKDHIPFIILEGDIRDFSNTFAQISNSDITAIFHLAGMSNIGDCEAKPDKAFSINALGTFNVVESIKRSKKNIRLIFSSTAQVYNLKIADKKSIIDESFPLGPQSVYAQTKLSAEQIVNNYFENQESLGTGVILRLFNHTDGSQKGPFFFPQLLKKIKGLKKESTDVLTGNLNIYRDFSLVEDLINLFIKILSTDLKEKTSTYNVCSGNSFLLKEVAQHIANELNIKVNFVEVPELMRKDEPNSIIASNQKAKLIFQWAPTNLSSNEFVKKILN